MCVCVYKRKLGAGWRVAKTNREDEENRNIKAVLICENKMYHIV